MLHRKKETSRKKAWSERKTKMRYLNVANTTLQFVRHLTQFFHRTNVLYKDTILSRTNDKQTNYNQLKLQHTLAS